MILKHRDRELIRFSWNRYGDVCDLEFDRRETRERLDLALYFVQKRIAEIKEFGAKADNKLKVSLKLGTIKEI